MSSRTEKSLDDLLEHSFADMLHIYKQDSGVSHKAIKPELIDDHKFRTIMFTVSSSDFRLAVLLHFLPKSRLPYEFFSSFAVDASASDQYYQDYISELGNNFSGVVCRVLGGAGLSTGMSTPVVLANAKCIPNFRAIGINYETHVGAFMDSTPLFAASFCLMVNKGLALDLHIPIPSANEQQEQLGELEFF
jgi:hypothetical protein